MKGMDKISRGSGFGGTIKYGFFGDKENGRVLEGRVIGGNMSGNDPDSLIREFNLTMRLRPDIEKPVWHNSLRLPGSDKNTDETWAKIGDAYMQKMGFTKNHPRVYILHDDTEGQHIHVIASRIAFDKKIFLGKNENLKSTKIISGLEKEFGLTKTKAPTYDAAGKIVMPGRSKLTKNEIEKAVRTGDEAERQQLQKLVSKALQKPVSATQFVEALQAGGVDVRVNIATTGRLNGFTFGLNGIYFSGSKLGAQYKLASLQERGLTYDQDRESSFLEQFRGKAEERGIDIGAAPSAVADGSNFYAEPGEAGDREHREIDVRDIQATGSEQYDHSRNAGEAVQQSDGQGTGRSEPGTDGHDAESPNGRGEATAGAGQYDGGAAGSGPGSGESTSISQEPEKSHVRTGNNGNRELVRNHVPSADAIDPDSGAGPIQTGDKVADELSRKMHNARLSEARKAIQAVEKFWAEMAASQLKAEAKDSKQQKPSALPGYQSHVAFLSEIAGLLNNSGDKYHGLMLEQLKGMRVKEFAVIAVDNSLNDHKIKPVPRTYTFEQLSKISTAKYLRQLNLNGQDIYIRPAHPAGSGLVLVDDLNQSQISTLSTLGLRPAVVMETSEHNFQAWIRINDTGFSRDAHAEITRLINEKVGGDQGSSDQEHFGRFVTFTNRKPTRILRSGEFPYVKLVSHFGAKAPAGEELLAYALERVEEARLATLEAAQAKALQIAAETEMRLPERASGTSIQPGWLSAAWLKIEALVSDGSPTDASKIDFRCAIELRLQGVSISEAIRLFDELPVRIRKGDNAEDYMLRTVTRAFALVDLRSEGLATKSVDLSAEARRRYPHVFETNQVHTAPPVLKTSNAIFAELKAEEARKALEALEASIDDGTDLPA
jgi:hypothetical protein